MPARRDPVSELFDSGARQLLARAYARPGEWAGTRIADPGPAHLSWALAQGINLRGRDNPSVIGGGRGGLNARDRWARGYVRALYYQHRWYSVPGRRRWRRMRALAARQTGALQVEVGRAVPARGVIPAGRAVRVRLATGGGAKLRAVGRQGDAGRIWAADGEPAARFSTPARRDWA